MLSICGSWIMGKELFYTYLWLREDGTPYYAGKGSGYRAFIHHSHRFPPPPKDRILVQEFPSEEDALAAERFLITYYGREDQGTGRLLNMTDGGDGLSNPSLKTRQKMREKRLGKPLTKECKLNLSRTLKTPGYTNAGRFQKTGHCHRGHPLIESNIHWPKSQKAGKCKICYLANRTLKRIQRKLQCHGRLSKSQENFLIQVGSWLPLDILAGHVVNAPMQ
jgi:hypothetical protein